MGVVGVVALFDQPCDETSDDVIAALLSLGCTSVEARKAAAGARKKLGDEARDEELVKNALRSMAKV